MNHSQPRRVTAENIHTWTKLAPDLAYSNASEPLLIPPHPMSSIDSGSNERSFFKAFNDSGKSGGPESPPISLRLSEISPAGR